VRILHLDLRAFGPFTDVALDLSAGHEGLHAIFGPNEAGKSSTLRALEQLFFGIPPRSADDFVHPYNSLRIGATLATAKGQTLTFLRRKGAKNTLLAADGLTPLDDDALRPFLDALDRELFRTMFGLGHEQLVHGGKEIASGQGDLGQLLFSAGSGIADLQKVRESLDSKAEELFTRRGNRQINQKLRALDEARKAIRQGQLSTSEWDTHDEQLRQASEQLATVDARLRELVREKSRLERLKQALPLIAKRRECRRQLEALGNVRLLGPHFAEQRRSVVTDLRVAQTTAESAEKELAPLQQQLDGIVIPESLMAHAESIRELQDALGSYRKAQRDLPGLQVQQEQLERTAASILREVRPDLSLEVIDQLRLTKPQKLAIQNLGARHETLLRQIEQSADEIAEAQSQQAEAEAQLAALEAPRNAAPLKAAIQRVQEQGKLDEQRQSLQTELDRLEEQTAIDLAKLGLWSGSLEALEQLTVPTAETVDRHEAVFTEIDQQLRSLKERLDDALSRRAEFDRQIEQLRLEGDVPTEDALFQARRLRDQGWQLVLEAWQQGETDRPRLEQFLAQFEEHGDLVSAYRHAVEAADELADRLRREATRVATRANLQASRDSLDEQIAALRQRIEAVQGERSRAEAAWLACWQPLGIKPLSPREMLVWLRRQGTLVEQAQTRRVLCSQRRQLDQRIQTCRNELGQCLADLGEPAVGDAETLAALLGRCRAVVEHIETVADRRQSLEKEIRQWSNRLTSAQAVGEKARAEQAAWQEQWAQAIEPLGLAPESIPAVANDLLSRIDEMFARLDKAQTFAERIDNIAQDAEGFTQYVARLAAEIDPALASRSADQAAEELICRLQKARVDRQKQQTLTEQRDRCRQQLQQARQEIQTLSVRLETMCQEAGCQSADELPEAERASETAIRLRESLGELDDQLLALSAGASLDALLDEAAAVNADELPGQLAQLEPQIEQLEDEKLRLQQTVWDEQRTLNSIDASSKAAEAAQQVQDLLAQIQTDAQQYVGLRLASAVLREGIQRYQRKNEAPVLSRASELFARLTLGSFERLSTDFDEQGQKVLVGVRPGGIETVGLAGMSDGACDQLYLALRLASLEHYLQDKEPIPFIVDDILVSFDDARSVAALEILGELSQKTQILFFTHHRHLVQLAKQRLKPEVLYVHELGEKREPVPEEEINERRGEG
jgi:uncharacterized protein YhaN